MVDTGQYLAEVRPFAFGHAPPGWARCDGQLLPIAEHEALFSLLGTTFGGDGKTTFALPDLRGRAAMHVGRYHIGERLGAEEHTLTLSELPRHRHELTASGDPADTEHPGILAALPLYTSYDRSSPPSLYPLYPCVSPPVRTLEPMAHENMMPFLAVSFCIAVEGAYPAPA